MMEPEDDNPEWTAEDFAKARPASEVCGYRLVKGDFAPPKQQGVISFERLCFRPSASAPGCLQAKVVYPNGYEASVLTMTGRLDGEEGPLQFDVAVLRGGEMDYSTRVTNDTLRWCDPEDVSEALRSIAGLAPPAP